MGLWYQWTENENFDGESSMKLKFQAARGLPTLAFACGSAFFSLSFLSLLKLQEFGSYKDLHIVAMG
jgi:hypothetical protein